MSVSVRPKRGGKGWEYDLRLRWPDGERFRERANAPVTSKSAALRWAENRAAELLARGKDAHNATPAPATPTLDAFWPRVLTDHYRAGRKKPSTIEAASTIVRLHLAPRLGTRPLNEISDADVAAIKGAYAVASPKTVNNILSVLSRILGCAVKWRVLKERPCEVELLPTPPKARPWYEVEEFRRMVAAARRLSTGHLALVLLAGSAGLRRGEIIALKWTDLDFTRGQVRVERAIWRGHEESPKGGRARIVPMTDELSEALSKHRHLRGERVLYSDKGRPLSNRTIRNWLGAVLRKAGIASAPRTFRTPKRAFVGKPCRKCGETLRRPMNQKGKAVAVCVACERKRWAADDGAIHRLRHTFCSHLAAAGVPAKAIQELAGHADLKTTLRYMHLAPGDRDGAMATLAGYYAGKGPAAGAGTARTVRTG
jgi:integrase